MTSLGKLVFVDIFEEKTDPSANEDDELLTLAYENLEDLPYNFIEGFADVTTLDLSHNQFKNLSFLARFTGLSTIILDHNEITSSYVFPHLPSVTLLWLNHNQIYTLCPFIKNLRSSFPGLRYLSLMGNPAAPSYLNGGTFYEYLQYRLFVISWFHDLIHLDDCAITDVQREESRRIYKRSLFDRFYKSTSPLSLYSDDSMRVFPSYLKSVRSKVLEAFIIWDRKHMRPILPSQNDSSRENRKSNAVI